jgi:hypothetical protein
MRRFCYSSTILGTFVVVTFAMLALSGAAQDVGDSWKALFNGKDFTGWDVWLGRPYAPKGKPKAEIIGLNNDERRVFSVVEVDSAPAIRVSGEVYGGLVSHQEFDNYHLKMQFKWGDKRWPPAEKSRRNSGLLYRSVGPFGAHDTFWMRSLEFQIMEGDVGDWWPIANTIVDVQAERKGKNIVFKKDGSKINVPTDDKISRIIKNPDNERPRGEWNNIELICLGPTSMHIVNGTVNMVLTDARFNLEGKQVPLGKGKIQLQSEGAEIFFRDISYRHISRLPEEYAK